MSSSTPKIAWATGLENQRKADLGDGTFLNPILAGDHPDPSILKDGDDYYLVASSFHRYPGLLIWHSKDLVNWEPIGPALHQYVGSVWAPDLVKHNGRYYIYFPGKQPGPSANYVVWADNINGPWSEPIDLKLGWIDPGHAVGPDGQRYLFMSGGHRIKLAADGLSTVGELEKIYDGWQYSEDWVVEGFAQEGPKMLRRGEYYYMVLAQGGTSGPPTSHMVVVARSKSIDGPWENSPYNPLIRTWNREEKWWSKGHATLVEGPDEQWYAVYHAYENGYYPLGRQTLLEPVVWTEDSWIKTADFDTALPIPKPEGGRVVPHGFPFTDNFSQNKIGVQWSFHDEYESSRYRYETNTLVLEGRGTSPKNSPPLIIDAGDHAYEVEVEIEISEGASAGLILFYNENLYAGLGFNRDHILFHRYGLDSRDTLPEGVGNTLRLRLLNDRHVVSIFYSLDGENWKRYSRGLEVAGYHQNVAGHFLSLRPALYAAGEGEVRFRGFRYQAVS